jgi:Na+/H+-dicarboxylate symporter
MDVIVGLVPRNLVSAMAEDKILPLIVFSLLLGAILTTMGEPARPVIDFVASFNTAILKFIGLIMVFAPIGILGLVAARLGQAELSLPGGFIGELSRLARYSGTVILGLLIHAFIVLPLVLRFLGKRPALPYARNMLTALATAFSTASSSATLPMTIQGVSERNRVSDRTSSFVLPLGATINMDGTALYEAVAAIFIAQVYNIDLTFGDQVVIVLTATLAAIGAAGIPEAGLVTMVLVLKAAGLPTEGIAVILAIDWFLDRCRTTVNVWGDAVGAAVVDRMEEGKIETTDEHR